MNSNTIDSHLVDENESHGWLGQALGLAGFLAICYGAAALGAIATDPTTDPWFQRLAQPSWAPPNWVFAPVWTTLYTLMGIGAFLTWRRGTIERGVRIALALFGVQIVFNVLWSWIFFFAHAPGAALVDIALLWFTIVAWLVATWRVTKVGALINVPYLAWVSFAAALNFAIWQLN